MLSRWPIRFKLFVGFAMLFLIVAMLSFSGFRGLYAYREIVKSVSRRATEIPSAANLTRHAVALRYPLTQLRPRHDFPDQAGYDPGLIREQFRMRLLDTKTALKSYSDDLADVRDEESMLNGKRAERETLEKIQERLDHIDDLIQDSGWVLDTVRIGALEGEVQQLTALCDELPQHLQKRMRALRDNVRTQYRTWIVMSWISSLLSAQMLVLLVWFFKHSVFRPWKILLAGSRRVAAGDFQHRITLHTHDEIAELAGAMNAMTDRFQQIRDDLDRQVRLRTKEVVRSEQLASVGFLAAGVAHEINNPLASIAWCAESLESRLHDLLFSNSPPADGSAKEVEVLRRYLRTIQNEAFRCKGITERLLDFSRLGDVERQPTDLKELVSGVIDMVQHLGRFRNKRIEFVCDGVVTAPVNGPEIKQVVLNLITNSLDSLDVGGTVRVALCERGKEAELLVVDNGCGMTEEVLRHLFEPFFTRRRDGSGTGLGLSIAYRIVTDHGGTIEAFSDGPGCGSQVRVTFPLQVTRANRHEKQSQAA